MSVHVCKCEHKGKVEYHLRYPGMSKSEAQNLANQLNGPQNPSIDRAEFSKLVESVRKELHFCNCARDDGGALCERIRLEAYYEAYKVLTGKNYAGELGE